VNSESANSALELFDQLVDLPAEQRRLWLEQNHHQFDASTRDELESLLAAHDDAGDFLKDAPPATPRSRVDPHEPGTCVGAYELLELLGEGGFARVFRAQQTRPLRREVAVKIVKLGMDTSAVIARFELERQALALMAHPNIAAVFDAGATDTGRPYFVMELVRGGQRITKYCDEQRLGVRQRVELFIDVCHAVQHAHEKGVLHRDLKPSNILVTSVDGRATPKIIDFGIAKAVSDELRLTDVSVVTLEQQLLGTPQYMSPEQARSGGADVDTRSDIYSLGAVLYEMLAGQSPLDSPTGPSTMLEQLQRLTTDEELPPPSTRATSELRRALRGELDWIIGKCLEKDRRRRYESAAALAADLEAHLHHRAIAAAPPTLHYRAKKFVRRNTLAVVASAIILASVLAGAIVSTVLAVRAIRAERLAQRRQEETQAVNDFLTLEIIGAANPLVTQGNREMTLREALENASKNVAGNFKGRPLSEAAVRESVGWAYRSLGRLDLALPHITIALDLRKQALGPDHPDTLQAEGSYAAILKSLNRLPEAEALYKDLIERYRRIGGQDTMSINAMENYAGVLSAEGRSAEAEPIAREAAETARRMLGEDSYKTLVVRSTHAAILRRLGKTVEAEEIFRDAYERSLRMRGPDYPDTIALMRHRASALNDLGRSAEAERLFREGLERNRRVYGEDHTRTLQSMQDVAAVMRAMGRKKEAMELFEQVLEGSRRIRKPDDPEHIDAMNNYAVGLQDVGRMAESEPLLKEVLELRRRVQGENHPMTLMAMNTYGATLEYLGRYDEAEVFVRQALQQRRHLLGDGHPQTLNSIDDYVDILTALHRDADAEPLSAELYEKAAKAQIAPRTVASYIAQYGPVLVRLGKYADAEAPLREAHRRLTETKQTTTGRMRSVLAGLADVCEQTNRPDEAAQWRRALETAQAATRPTTAPTTAATIAPATQPIP
jgi:serine/threonine protein kinase